MRARWALRCCLSLLLPLLRLPRAARARAHPEQGPALPSLLGDHPGMLPPTLAQPTGSPQHRVITSKLAPQLGAHLALQHKLLAPKLAPGRRLLALRLSPHRGARLAPQQRLLAPKLPPWLGAHLAPWHKQLTSKFTPQLRLLTPQLAPRLGAHLAPQDGLLTLQLAPRLGAHRRRLLTPQLAAHFHLGARLGARRAQGARSRRHAGGQLVRVGCVLGTCQVQNLSHRLWQLVGHPGHRDLAPVNPNSPHSYG